MYLYYPITPEGKINYNAPLDSAAGEECFASWSLGESSASIGLQTNFTKIGFGQLCEFSPESLRGLSPLDIHQVLQSSYQDLQRLLPETTSLMMFVVAKNHIFTIANASAQSSAAAFTVSGNGMDYVMSLHDNVISEPFGAKHAFMLCDRQTLEIISEAKSQEALLSQLAGENLELKPIRAAIPNSPDQIVYITTLPELPRVVCCMHSAEYAAKADLQAAAQQLESIMSAHIESVTHAQRKPSQRLTRSNNDGFDRFEAGLKQNETIESARELMEIYRNRKRALQEDKTIRDKFIECLRIVITRLILESFSPNSIKMIDLVACYQALVNHYQHDVFYAQYDFIFDLLQHPYWQDKIRDAPKCNELHDLISFVLLSLEGRFANIELNLEHGSSSQQTSQLVAGMKQLRRTEKVMLDGNNSPEERAKAIGHIKHFVLRVGDHSLDFDETRDVGNPGNAGYPEIEMLELGYSFSNNLERSLQDLERLALQFNGTERQLMQITQAIAHCLSLVNAMLKVSHPSVIEFQYKFDLLLSRQFRASMADPNNTPEQKKEVLKRFPTQLREYRKSVANINHFGQRNVGTCADSNCGFNVFALAIFDLVRLGKLPEEGRELFYQLVQQELNLESPTQAALNNWCLALNDPLAIQKRLAKILRKMAIENIRTHYEHLKEHYQATLLAFMNAIIEYKRAERAVYPDDDVKQQILQGLRTSIEIYGYSEHRAIVEKVREFAESVIDGPLELDENENLPVLTAWWEDTGKDLYFANLARNPEAEIERDTWADEGMLNVVACQLGVAFTWHQYDAMQTVGLAAGVFNGSYEDIKILQHLSVISKHLDGRYYIKRFNSKDELLLRLTTLTDDQQELAGILLDYAMTQMGPQGNHLPQSLTELGSNLPAKFQGLTETSLVQIYYAFVACGFVSQFNLDGKVRYRFNTDDYKDGRYIYKDEFIRLQIQGVSQPLRESLLSQFRMDAIPEIHARNENPEAVRDPTLHKHGNHWTYQRENTVAAELVMRYAEALFQGRTLDDAKEGEFRFSQVRRDEPRHAEAPRRSQLRRSEKMSHVKAVTSKPISIQGCLGVSKNVRSLFAKPFAFMRFGGIKLAKSSEFNGLDDQAKERVLASAVASLDSTIWSSKEVGCCITVMAVSNIDGGLRVLGANVGDNVVYAAGTELYRLNNPHDLGHQEDLIDWKLDMKIPLTRALGFQGNDNIKHTAETFQTHVASRVIVASTGIGTPENGKNKATLAARVAGVGTLEDLSDELVESFGTNKDQHFVIVPNPLEGNETVIVCVVNAMGLSAQAEVNMTISSFETMLNAAIFNELMGPEPLKEDPVVAAQRAVSQRLESLQSSASEEGFSAYVSAVNQVLTAQRFAMEDSRECVSLLDYADKRVKNVMDTVIANQNLATEQRTRSCKRLFQCLREGALLLQDYQQEWHKLNNLANPNRDYPALFLALIDQLHQGEITEAQLNALGLLEYFATTAGVALTREQFELRIKSSDITVDNIINFFKAKFFEAIKQSYQCVDLCATFATAFELKDFMSDEELISQLSIDNKMSLSQFPVFLIKLREFRDFSEFRRWWHDQGFEQFLTKLVEQTSFNDLVHLYKAPCGAVLKAIFPNERTLLMITNPVGYCLSQATLDDEAKTLKQKFRATMCTIFDSLTPAAQCFPQSIFITRHPCLFDEMAQPLKDPLFKVMTL